jgi:probable rRNA maturation factor
MVLRKELKNEITAIDCQVTLRKLKPRFAADFKKQISYFNRALAPYLLKFFKEQGLNISYLGLPDKKIAIGLVICGKRRIQGLNLSSRNKDKPTDVLSFPLYESLRIKKNAKEFLQEPILNLGDIVICLPIAEAQARGHKIPLSLELAHLFMHGLLHLLGFDHEINDKEAKLMFALEEKLVKQVFVFTKNT